MCHYTTTNNKNNLPYTSKSMELGPFQDVPIESGVFVIAMLLEVISLVGRCGAFVISQGRDNHYPQDSWDESAHMNFVDFYGINAG